MSTIRLARLRVAALSLLLPVLLAGLGVQSASAAQPTGGCPANYELVTVKYVVKGAGLEESDPSMDPNGDGFTCLQLLDTGSGTRATWHDNTL